MYVVTEFGMVNWNGECIAERAKEITALGRPDFREDLELRAYEIRLIPRGVSVGLPGNPSHGLRKSPTFAVDQLPQFPTRRTEA
jgi:acyl-CoA hydrolase